MIAAGLIWKENAPSGLPQTAEIPIGVEVEYARQQYKNGVIRHWLELTYHWGLKSFILVDE